MPKLSVIVNAKNKSLEHVQKTLNSVLACTEKNISVIAVCLNGEHPAVSKKFNTVKWIRVKENLNTTEILSAALDVADDYVCFLNAGDEVFFAYYENLLKQASKTKADICTGDIAFFKNGKLLCLKHTLKTTNGSWGAGQMFKAYLENHFADPRIHTLNGKIFKKSLIAKAVNQMSGLNFSTEAISFAMAYFAIKNANSVKYSSVGHVTVSKNLIISEKFLKEISAFFVFVQSECLNHELCDVLNFHLNECKKFFAKTCLKLLKTQKDTSLKALVKKHIYSKPTLFVSLKDLICSATAPLPSNAESLNTELKKVYSSNKHLFVYAKHNSYTYKILKQMQQNLPVKFEFIDNLVNSNIILSEDKF